MPKLSRKVQSSRRFVRMKHSVVSLRSISQSKIHRQACLGFFSLRFPREISLQHEQRSLSTELVCNLQQLGVLRLLPPQDCNFLRRWTFFFFSVSIKAGHQFSSIYTLSSAIKLSRIHGGSISVIKQINKRLRF